MRAREIAFASLFVLVAGACGARTEIFAPEASRADPFCGDGLPDPGEICDDGNEVVTDACVPPCSLARCGDGIVRAAVEACDDGNTTSGDGCTASCALPSCGNGIVEPGEVCDDGNGIDTDECPSRCLPAICGDGFVHAGFEACDDGAANADRPAFLLVQGSLVRPIVPVVRSEGVVSFYGYSSASAHTGFEELGVSKLFLYRDAEPGGKLGLVTLHGIDKSPEGELQPESLVEQAFLGLPEGTFVAISDDGKDGGKGEFLLVEPTAARGEWEFEGNSDGGALSGLVSPGSFVIEVIPSFQQGIGRWEYVDGGGEKIVLAMDAAAKILSLEVPSTCRLDCTVPRCGDAILDAGEICDDGNTIPGDGCAPDCRSTN
jgi:cysteine-rich repeat protein